MTASQAYDDKVTAETIGSWSQNTQQSQLFFQTLDTCAVVKETDEARENEQEIQDIPEAMKMDTNKSSLEQEDEEEIEWDKEEEDEGYSDKELGSKFGVVQALADNDKHSVVAKIQETKEYMDEFAKTTDPFVYLCGDCWNSHQDCTLWAMEGECAVNPEYMNEECSAVCQKCQAPEGPGVEFGVAQLLENENSKTNLTEAVTAKLAETQEYMRQVVWSDDFYLKVRKLCFNYYPMCTVWAVEGECEQDESMVEDCAPACGTCKQLHYETRCPIDQERFPDIWKPGDLNRAFERILAIDAYNTTVWSRPDYLPGHTEETAEYDLGAWIITIDDFITKDEAKRLIEWGGAMGYERSEVEGGTEEETGNSMEGEIDEDRTSTNAWCSKECKSDEVVIGIFERIENMTGVPPENSEDIQLLRCKMRISNIEMCSQHVVEF